MRGTDSDAAPQERQLEYNALVKGGVKPIEAARQAAYACPKQGVYDNRRSPLLARHNRDEFDQARQVLLTDPEVDASTHPLGDSIAVLRGLQATKSVTLVAMVEVADERGRVRTHKQFEVVQDADNMARLKAAELKRTLEGRHPSVQNKLEVKVDARRQTLNVMARPTSANFLRLPAEERIRMLQERLSAARAGRDDEPLDAQFDEADAEDGEG